MNDFKKGVVKTRRTVRQVTILLSDGDEYVLTPAGNKTEIWFQLNDVQYYSGKSATLASAIARIKRLKTQPRPVPT